MIVKPNFVQLSFDLNLIVVFWWCKFFEYQTCKYSPKFLVHLYSLFFWFADTMNIEVQGDKLLARLI